jgi:hydroxymethylbilane synthase
VVSEGIKRLRIGTRGSLLARTQTGMVVEQLRAANPGVEIETQIIQTTGDVQRNVPFAQVGTKGMFVKEIEQALLDGSIDVGVHSLKDMPSELPEGLELSCVPRREDPLDALLSRNNLPFSELPLNAVVGTSSLRRQAQLRALRPDIEVRELRGNLDTRMRKLDDGEYDAIMLAVAGLNRLGLAARITERLSPVICVPAAGQGALALETRCGDTAVLALLHALHDPETEAAVTAERAFLEALGGGCSVPAGALATVHGDRLHIIGLIAAPDGSRVVRAEREGDLSAAAQIGAELSATLLTQGGRDLLKG